MVTFITRLGACRIYVIPYFWSFAIIIHIVDQYVLLLIVACKIPKFLNDEKTVLEIIHEKYTVDDRNLKSSFI